MRSIEQDLARTFDGFPQANVTFPMKSHQNSYVDPIVAIAPRFLIDSQRVAPLTKTSTTAASPPPLRMTDRTALFATTRTTWRAVGATEVAPCGAVKFALRASEVALRAVKFALRASEVALRAVMFRDGITVPAFRF